MLLAVDTSTAQLGLALYDGATVAAELTWTSRARHTVELAPALSGLMSRVGLSMSDLSALAVALGPGSFTSLRVGLAFVKGLALARKLPIIGVPTLDAGPLLIEWAERIEKILPRECLWVTLEHVSEEHRQMRFVARGKRYDALLTNLRQSMFGVA